MDKHKRHKTEKWNRENTEIIHIYGRTRIGCCTSKRVIYEITTDDLRFLEDVVKELECHTRDRHQENIPEYRSSFRKSIEYHEWEYRKHHDTSPPAELTRIESISTIKPCTRHILIGWISKIGEIERARYREHRLNDNTRDKPVMISTKTTIQRKSLKCVKEHEERQDNVFSGYTENISEEDCAKKEDKKWYPVGKNCFHRKIIAKTFRNKKKVFVFSQKIG
jgi:hypothetical protein